MLLFYVYGVTILYHVATFIWCYFFMWCYYFPTVLLFIDVLGGHGSDSESSSSGEASSDDEEEENEEEDGGMQIQDETQMNTMALRRTIYLTIMSSLSFEECAHKMLQMTIKPGQEVGGATTCAKLVIIKMQAQLSFTISSCILTVKYVIKGYLDC